jgi:hypothetical protein
VDSCEGWGTIHSGTCVADCKSYDNGSRFQTWNSGSQVSLGIPDKSEPEDQEMQMVYMVNTGFALETDPQNRRKKIACNQIWKEANILVNLKTESRKNIITKKRK